MCTFDRTAKGNCSVIQHDSVLPAEFRYYQDPKLGGTIQEADFCPFVTSFSNTVCNIAAYQPDDYFNAPGSRPFLPRRFERYLN
jgi:hypothetical protein